MQMPGFLVNRWSSVRVRHPASTPQSQIGSTKTQHSEPPHTTDTPLVGKSPARDSRLFTPFAILAFVVALSFFTGPPAQSMEREAASHHSTASRSKPFKLNTSTWYGPGFYGNHFACSGRIKGVSRYWRNVRGTAHMTLPCGTRVMICNRSNRRCVIVMVIDTGAFHRGNFDLTARTAMDLCACSKPYTMKTKWLRV